MRKRNPIMLEEAQERLMKIKMKEETETVWVTEALGRVCAENIYAVMDPVSYTHLTLPTICSV